MVQFQTRPVLTLQIVFFLFLFSANAEETHSVSLDSNTSKQLLRENPSASRVFSPPSSTDSMDTRTLLKSNKMFAHLGDFHKSKGILGVITGMVGILAGVVLLDKVDSAPLSISCMALGGVSIGFGIWEIRLGRTLLTFGSPAK